MPLYSKEHEKQESIEIKRRKQLDSHDKKHFGISQSTKHAKVIPKGKKSGKAGHMHKDVKGHKRNQKQIKHQSQDRYEINKLEKLKNVAFKKVKRKNIILN
jgi:hypothetical protein